MKKRSKKLVYFLIASQFLMAAIFYNTNLSVKANSIIEGKINIDVSDSTGEKTRFNYSPGKPNLIGKQDIILKGDSYVSMAMDSREYNTMQYKIVRSITNEDILNTEEGWKDINLNEQIINNDVMTDKKGFLKHKPYNVNHLPATANESYWNDRSIVYKNPYSGSSIVSAARVKDAKDYGKMENYIEDGRVQSRFVNNTIFLEDTTNKKVYYTNGNMNTITDSQTRYYKPAAEVYLGRNYKEASKIWGYLKVDETAEYNFQSFSDDGLYAYIIVNGVKKEIVNRSMFKVHGNLAFEYNERINLNKDKYYPIYIEYFNWGGDASFQMHFKKSTEGYNNYKQIPSSNFYPSRSDYPGEYAESIFTGANGEKLPSESGRYYIAYRAVNKDKNGKIIKKGEIQGVLGPYLVEPRAKLSVSKKILTLNGNEINVKENRYEVNGKSFKIKYQIKPLPIKVEELIGNIKMSSDMNEIPQTYTMTITNAQLSVILPNGLNYSNPKENSVVEGKKSYNNINISDIEYELDKVNKVYTPVTKPESFIHEIKGEAYGSYTLNEEYSKLIYKDVDGGNRELKFGVQEIVLGAGTEVIENGLYNTNTNKLQTIIDNTTLKTMFPSTFAMKVEINSLNSTVNIVSNGIEANIFDLIKYELNSDESINKETKEIKKVKGKSFSISNDKNFKLDINKKYLVIYQVRPNRGEMLNIVISNEDGIEKYNKSILTQDPPILK